MNRLDDDFPQPFPIRTDVPAIAKAMKATQRTTFMMIFSVRFSQTILSRATCDCEQRRRDMNPKLVGLGSDIRK
jgi:hypothetical protein